MAPNAISAATIASPIAVVSSSNGPPFSTYAVSLAGSSASAALSASMSAWSGVAEVATTQPVGTVGRPVFAATAGDTNVDIPPTPLPRTYAGTVSFCRSVLPA